MAMPESKLKTLRAAYGALRGHREYLAKMRTTRVDKGFFRILKQDVITLESHFPGLLPSLDESDHRWQKAKEYWVEGLLAYLNSAIPRLEVELDHDQPLPVIETRKFTFVKDSALRNAIERDYSEIQRALIASCPKSVMILAGGVIEALLLDALRQDATSAKASSAAPKNKKGLDRWNLSDLINVGIDLGLIKGGAAKLSHSIREYRNLVHPGNEIRNRLDVKREEARIAIEVLHIIHRDLSP